MGFHVSLGECKVYDLGVRFKPESSGAESAEPDAALHSSGTMVRFLPRRYSQMRVQQGSVRMLYEDISIYM